MEKIVLSAFVLLTATFSFSQTSNNPLDFNFGFEQQGFAGQFPTNWVNWGSGYTLKIDTEVKHSGSASMLMQYLEDTPPTPGSFGCIAHSIPATFDAAE